MTSVHVNDFIHSGIKLFEDHVLNKLHPVFKISKTAKTLFKFIQLDTPHRSDHVETSQKEYATLLNTLLQKNIIKNITSLILIKSQFYQELLVKTVG